MRSFHVSIICLLTSPRATCNYRNLFYSVSDYINQRRIINQEGWNSQTVICTGLYGGSFFKITDLKRFVHLFNFDVLLGIL